MAIAQTAFHGGWILVIFPFLLHLSVSTPSPRNSLTNSGTQSIPGNAAVIQNYNDIFRKQNHSTVAFRGDDGTDNKDAPSGPIISPSLLACDWSSIKSEVARCLASGVSRLHIDVFDGVFLDSPLAFTFGPQMIRAIHQSCDGEPAELDLHVCVEQPKRFVEPMAEAGATRFIFQWEAMSGDRVEAATGLAKDICRAGMKCGVSINPNTTHEEIMPLLETGLVDVVDCLAVNPGFGGQTFQNCTLGKMKSLAEWRKKNSLSFLIMCDGGVNNETVGAITQSGADILVAGTFLFSHPYGLGYGLDELRRSSRNEVDNTTGIP